MDNTDITTEKSVKSLGITLDMHSSYHGHIKELAQKANQNNRIIYATGICLFGFLTSSSTTRLYRGRAPRQRVLTILRAATLETELGDHDFCLIRSHYTDTDPTSRERAATAGIEPGTSAPEVARSTD